MQFYKFKNSNSAKTIFFSSFVFLVIVLLAFTSCSQSSTKKNQVIVIGIPSDVATINPLFAFNLQEGHLMDLLYLKPAAETWNDSLGTIEFKPMLAESWIINKDSNFVTLNIRNGIKWSDGEPITVDDIISSFDVYSDPKVNSRLYGLFNNFYTSEDLHIDLKKTFRKNSETSLTIYFKDFENFTFLDINHAILPAHIYKSIKRENIETSDINFNPVTSGPFKLYKWERDQKIHLWADSACYLFNPNNVQEIIFKIVPDEFSLITQLKNGEIDISEDIKSEKVKELIDDGDLNIGSIKGRNYDYVGWNNIDPAAKQNKLIKPNKFFSSFKTRKALSLSINRQEIFQAIVGKYGEIYDSPISPIFKPLVNDSLRHIVYNPSLAKKILAEDGWKDSNGNGILDKNNQEFSFKIYSTSGNSKREYAATIIKNNLKEIGVDAELVFVERNKFVDGLLSRKYDSWIAGWIIEIPLNLKPYWSSDPDEGMLNFSSFTNKGLDKIMNELKPSEDEANKIELYKKASNIFSEYEPVTILFWSDDIVAYNKRVKNINFSPIGLFSGAWKWETEK